ncbi:MAG: helix-turn-helix transcriptional regulator [Clostridiales bacterium]|nr:helix-turn-helix transcriptional regulator [Clostridiales bacterium]
MQDKDLMCKATHVHDEVCEQVVVDMPDENALYDVAELFKIFGDSTRIRILSALAQAEMCVCDIGVVLNMTKSAVSHQLRILRQAKLVKNRRSGKEIFYSLDDDHVLSIIKLALEHIQE